MGLVCILLGANSNENERFQEVCEILASLYVPKKIEVALNLKYFVENS